MPPRPFAPRMECMAAEKRAARAAGHPDPPMIVERRRPNGLCARKQVMCRVPMAQQDDPSSSSSRSSGSLLDDDEEELDDDASVLSSFDMRDALPGAEYELAQQERDRRDRHFARVRTVDDQCLHDLQEQTRNWTFPTDFSGSSSEDLMILADHMDNITRQLRVLGVDRKMQEEDNLRFGAPPVWVGKALDRNQLRQLRQVHSAQNVSAMVTEFVLQQANPSKIAEHWQVAVDCSCGTELDNGDDCECADDYVEEQYENGLRRGYLTAHLYEPLQQWLEFAASQQDEALGAKIREGCFQRLRTTLEGLKRTKHNALGIKTLKFLLREHAPTAPPQPIAVVKSETSQNVPPASNHSDEAAQSTVVKSETSENVPPANNNIDDEGEKKRKAVPDKKKRKARARRKGVFD